MDQRLDWTIGLAMGTESESETKTKTRQGWTKPCRTDSMMKGVLYARAFFFINISGLETGLD